MLHHSPDQAKLAVAPSCGICWGSDCGHGHLLGWWVGARATCSDVDGEAECGCIEIERS